MDLVHMGLTPPPPPPHNYGIYMNGGLRKSKKKGALHHQIFKKSSLSPSSLWDNQKEQWFTAD